MPLRRLRTCSVRCLRVVWEALAAFGACWLQLPRDCRRYPAVAAEPPPRRRTLTDIAPLHPERLCPAVPLTPVELRLQRELTASCRSLSRRLAEDVV